MYLVDLLDTSSKEDLSMSSFKDLRVVDDFYQTSLFFPMPTVLISTLTEDGKTTVGPYSLVQPYYVAGKDYYAMLLNARNSSNTAQKLLRNGKCAINFVTDEKKTFKEVVRLGWPGDKPEEKMKDCIFTFEKGIAEGGDRPMVVTEAFQVIECTWARENNVKLITAEHMDEINDKRAQEKKKA